MSQILCPRCGGSEWKAVEQFTSLVPCQLVREETGEVTIELDSRAEFVRDAATSVVISYACDRDGCGYAVSAADLQAGRATS